MVERIASSGVGQSSFAVACDCTIELPLPDRFPRPRVYLCLGNVLGAITAVGAVRLLRVLRTSMTPSDSLVLGLEPRQSGAVRALSDEEFDASASRHLGALGVVNSAVGGAFDLSCFEFRATVDAENSRLETHVVARRAHEVEVPGVCALRLRKGESIRTSVRCMFDRNRVAAMLTGVGLALRHWSTDADGRYVVALAAPAV
jgi:L-histidine N-alpha-methyltransferase